MSGALAGKYGGVFTSTASQHGGQETTILSFLSHYAHHGINFVPLGPTPEVGTIDEVIGGGPWGAGAIAGGHGQRAVTVKELAIARAQGVNFGKTINKPMLRMQSWWARIRSRHSTESGPNCTTQSSRGRRVSGHAQHGLHLVCPPVAESASARSGDGDVDSERGDDAATAVDDDENGHQDDDMLEGGTANDRGKTRPSTLMQMVDWE
ncbi:hypothetical protein HK405_011907 [Cladochytrium tenue]|nr:hypothetical protein HK405_011907 [Cladochytrium tenue]